VQERVEKLQEARNLRRPLERMFRVQPAGAPSPGAKRQAEQQKKGMKEPAAAPKTHAPPAADTASAAPPVSAAGQQNARAEGAGAAKKPDPQESHDC
jgi:hypothetical protein